MKNNKRWSKKEAATFYNVSISTIERWMRQGWITYIKIGRRVLFDPTQLELDIAAFKTKAEPQTQPEIALLVE